MAVPLLTAFWIKAPSPQWPLGFGVTALSLDDALFIIRALGYGRFLPEDLRSLDIHGGISLAELDQAHVIPNMGPIVVRGMWFPFVNDNVSMRGSDRDSIIKPRRLDS